MASVSPDCGIDWSWLAGIGRIESKHGQYGGARLAPNGDSTPHVIGEALNGVKWDYITDTDGGRYDGDTRFDHAVGPMQFIPSTCAIYGTDANGDGVADPFNVNDAALAAARYLCTAGRARTAHSDPLPNAHAASIGARTGRYVRHRRDRAGSVPCLVPWSCKKWPIGFCDVNPTDESCSH
jgi:membrane-bound lytic murein transglycosylase B